MKARLLIKNYLKFIGTLLISVGCVACFDFPESLLNPKPDGPIIDGKQNTDGVVNRRDTRVIDSGKRLDTRKIDAPPCPHSGCTGGCDQSTCTVKCTGANCTCPTGLPQNISTCVLDCTDPAACGGEVKCGDEKICNVNCTGNEAGRCAGAIKCGRQKCTVTCKNAACQGEISCDTTQAKCLDVSISCDASSCKTINCNNACSCELECGTKCGNRSNFNFTCLQTCSNQCNAGCYLPNTGTCVFTPNDCRNSMPNCQW